MLRTDQDQINNIEWERINDTLSMIIYGDFEPVGKYVEYRSPEEVSQKCSLNWMQRLRKESSRVPQEYRNDHPRFDEKLTILEEAILIRAE